jgi:hypothetical protein
MPAIDTDDVLMRLVTAYETGSASALGRLLSPHMAGRRALLADYERIFRETTARTLRLGQLRHQRLDDRVKSSGPATVLTVSRSNACSLKSRSYATGIRCSLSAWRAMPQSSRVRCARHTRRTAQASA